MDKLELLNEICNKIDTNVNELMPKLTKYVITQEIVVFAVSLAIIILLFLLFRFVYSKKDKITEILRNNDDLEFIALFLSIFSIVAFFIAFVFFICSLCNIISWIISPEIFSIKYILSLK